jgi:hypothetical protein
MSTLTRMLELTNAEIESRIATLQAQKRFIERDLETANRTSVLLCDAYGALFSAIVNADNPDAVLDHIDHDLYVTIRQNGQGRKIDNIKALRQRYHMSLGDCKTLIESLHFDIEIGDRYDY